MGLELIHGGSQAFGVLLGDDGGHAEDLTRAHHHRGDVHAVVEPVDDGTEALLDVADEDGGARGIEPSGEYGTMRGHVGVLEPRCAGGDAAGGDAAGVPVGTDERGCRR